MTYKIDVDSLAHDQIRAMPRDLLGALAEIMAVLELAPWSGMPYNEAKPDGTMREQVFGPHGRGKVTYLILEEQRRVDVLRVMWLG